MVLFLQMHYFLSNCTAEMENRRKLVTMEEKRFVLQMVHKYKDLLENKKTDTVTVDCKKRKWQEICDAFNRIAYHNKKTVDQIKKIWDNEKTKRKKELAEGKRACFWTDVDPPPIKLEFSPEMCEGAHIEHAHFIADSNSLVENSPENVSTPEAKILVVEDLGTDMRGSEHSEKSCFEKSTLRMSCNPRRHKVKSSLLFKKIDIISKEAQWRIKRIQRQMMHEEELHQMRLVQEGELHQLRLKEAILKVHVVEKQLEK